MAITDSWGWQSPESWCGNHQIVGVADSWSGNHQRVGMAINRVRVAITREFGGNHQIVELSLFGIYNTMTIYNIVDCVPQVHHV